MQTSLQGPWDTLRILSALVNAVRHDHRKPEQSQHVARALRSTVSTFPTGSQQSLTAQEVDAWLLTASEWLGHLHLHAARSEHPCALHEAFTAMYALLPQSPTDSAASGAGATADRKV